MTAGIVAQLQGELALKSLPVRDPRLGFKPCPPWPWLAPADLSVPGPHVAVDGERDLRTPAEARGEPSAESFEQRELRAIADRVTGGVRPHRQVEAQDAEPGTKLWNVEAQDLPSFEPAQLRVRRPRGGRARAQAQARGGPSLAVLAAKAPKRIARAASSSISWSFTSGHSRAAWRWTLHRRLTARYARHTNGRSGGSRRGSNVAAGGDR